MPSFSIRSKNNLSQCDIRLQAVLLEVIKHFDFTVICGYRGKEDQDKAFAEGKSKLKYPHSKHNKLPSLAVDIAPYPIDWKNIEAFKELAIRVKAEANKQGFKIVWGGDWKFKDYPHFEIQP